MPKFGDRDGVTVSSKKAISAYLRFLEALNTPVALATSMLIKYGEWDQLVRRKIDSRDYTSVDAFRKDYQAVSGLRKASFLPTTIDKRLSAVDKFKASELKCGETNLLFETPERVFSRNPAMFALLERARNLIARILGGLPKELDYRFGPGVTSLIKGSVTLPKKYGRVIHVTPELYCYWRDIVGPVWASHVTDVRIVSGSSISFVPKDGTTDRSIAIEPHLNIYAQLGIGAAMRRRFKRWIDLDNGADRNRALVAKAHAEGYSTIDLSSASDSIARKLVEYLLPEDWWLLCDTTRSHRYTLDGVESFFSKFSSMGNGFTFELESIIFYALARSVGASRQVCAVFGDDIIVEREFYDPLVELLEFCGFTVNRDKSFRDGSFFESCGHDYFMGVNVRPFFWKTADKAVDQFKRANDIRLWASAQGYCDKTFLCAWQYCVLQIPINLRRCRVPIGYGDVGIVCERGEVVVKELPGGLELVETLALHYRSEEIRYGTSLEGYLSSLDRCSYTSVSPVRGRGNFRVGRLSVVSWWPGPGSWK